MLKNSLCAGNPEFQVGKNYVIIITWATGRKILNYTVQRPPPKQPRLPEPPPANLVSVNPASGSEINADGTIAVTFDKDPIDLTASAGTVVGSGKTRTISGPFKPRSFRSCYRLGKRIPKAQLYCRRSLKLSLELLKLLWHLHIQKNRLSCKR